MTSLREKWAAGSDTLGLWLTLPSSLSAEIAARESVDYVCVDTQHGAIGYEDSIRMIQAIALAGATPVARVALNDPGLIGKSLDIGAHAVIVPMIETPDDAAEVVAAVRYPPHGKRSYGPIMSGIRRYDYVSWARDHTAVIAMIETAEALDNIDDILSVKGIDAIYVGPADLSLALGLKPQNNDGEPEFDEAINKILRACRRRHVVAGIHASGALVRRRREQGFQMITVANDLQSMRKGISEELAIARGEKEGEARPEY